MIGNVNKPSFVSCVIMRKVTIYYKTIQVVLDHGHDFSRAEKCNTH